MRPFGIEHKPGQWHLPKSQKKPTLWRNWSHCETEKVTLVSMTRLCSASSIALYLFTLPLFGASPKANTDGASFDSFTAREAAEWNAIGAGTQRAFDSRAVEKDESTPTCHSIPTASVTASDAPQINILAPTLGRPLVSPLDIEVQFVPAASNAVVRADTFRVCYVGFFTVDVTKRITDRATVAPNGLRVFGAQLPRGHHHVVMLISDQDGRIGRRDATFDIQ